MHKTFYHILFTAALFHTHATFAADPVPTLLLEPAELDFGRVAQETILQRDVLVRNSGELPLEILKVNPDCGCTTSTLAQAQLAPGQTTTLHVSFETRHATGEVRRRIQVATTQGIRDLPIRATVVPYTEWDIEPAPLVFPPSLADQSTQMELRLVHRGKAPVALTSALANLPWLKVELLAGEIEGSYVVRLRKNRDAPSGTNSAVLMLQTSDLERPVLSIPVIVPVASELRAAPNPIVFPPAKVGEESSTAFRVFGWKGEKPPEVIATPGSVRYLGSINGEYTFEVHLTPEAVGSSIGAVKVLRGERVELDIPTVLRSDP